MTIAALHRTHHALLGIRDHNIEQAQAMQFVLGYLPENRLKHAINRTLTNGRDEGRSEKKPPV